MIGALAIIGACMLFVGFVAGIVWAIAFMEARKMEMSEHLREHLKKNTTQ